MSTLYGLLGISDIDTTLYTIGQDVVWDAVQQLIAAHNAELTKATNAFVQSETTNFTEKYKLPAGGMMQRADANTRPDAVKLYGDLSVAYDLEDFRDAMGWNDIDLAYMTIQQVNAELLTVVQRDINTVRYNILQHLLNKTNATWYDQYRATSLTIRRLANADGVNYPPVVGSATETTSHAHYAGTNYTAANISDTNNPFVTARDHIEEHFGQGQIVSFINKAQRAKVEALTNFAEVVLNYQSPASTITTSSVPDFGVPGQVIGTCDSNIVSVWNWIPDGYMLSLDISQPAPLKRRVDVPAQLRGFGIVAEDMEYPFRKTTWRRREGYGVANRLNGYVQQFVASTTYTTPTGY